MFIGVDSLHLLEDYFLQSSWLGLINNLGFNVFQSFFYTAAAFFVYSCILSVLYQKKIFILRYVCASILYCFLSIAPVFAIHIFFPPEIGFYIEDFFSMPPPYQIFFIYLLCTYFLRIDKTVSLITAVKLYIVAAGNVVIYYTMESLFFFLFTNNPRFQLLIYFTANSLLFLLNVIIAIFVIRFIKRQKLWLDAHKIKKSADSITKTLLLYMALFLIFWLFVSSILKLLSYSTSIVVVECGIIPLLLIFILLFYVSYMGDRIKIAKADLDNQTTHVNSLISSIDNFRTLKHDMHNMLSVYDGYVKLKEWDKLLQYNASMQGEARLAEGLLDISAKYSINPVLRTLLSTKLSEARAKGAFINISILADTDHLNIDPLDLARVTGILLDNAMEETMHTEAKTILFSLQAMKSGSILVSVSNPTASDVDVKKIMEKDYSTKNGHHGLGLFSLWNIVNKTPGCRLSIEYLNKVITFYLELA